MGGDGGSIPTRDDLVKTKSADSKVAETTRLQQLWSFCALSKQPLQAPIVSCPLGKLYNKESLLSFLLSPASSFGNDGLLTASHIRSLRDVTTLTLTPNPSLPSSHSDASTSTLIGTQESRLPSLFVDPISLRELNGSVKTVYRKPCGCVLTESTLREMRRANAAEGEGVDVRVCPVDGRRDEEGRQQGGVGEEEFVVINPGREEEEEMREVWEARKVREKEEKKAAKGGRKRKSALGEGGEEGAELEKKVKKVKSAEKEEREKEKETGPSIKASSTVPRLSATLAQKLAEQKKAHSPAVASLYASKDQDPNHDKNGRSTWMTRGAFTRFA